MQNGAAARLISDHQNHMVDTAERGRAGTISTVALLQLPSSSMEVATGREVEKLRSNGALESGDAVLSVQAIHESHSPFIECLSYQVQSRYQTLRLGAEGTRDHTKHSLRRTLGMSTVLWEFSESSFMSDD